MSHPNTNRMGRNDAGDAACDGGFQGTSHVEGTISFADAQLPAGHWRGLKTGHAVGAR